MQAEMTKTAEEKKQAILKAVDELQCYAEPEVFKSTLNEVLIDWLTETDGDRDFRGKVSSKLLALIAFLGDIEAAEA